MRNQQSNVEFGMLGKDQESEQKLAQSLPYEL